MCLLCGVGHVNLRQPACLKLPWTAWWGGPFNLPHETEAIKFQKVQRLAY